MRFWRAVTWLLLCGILLTLVVLDTTAVRAAGYTVTDAASLIAAINAANASPEDDIISLANDITLTAVAAVVDGNNGLPSITSRIIIQGNGFRIVRAAAAPAFRIFHVSATGTLWLDNVTVGGGRVLGLGVAGSGAAILNWGSLFLTRTVIGGSVPNSAERSGGGIYTNSSVLAVDTQIDNNLVNPSILTGYGGGITLEAMAGTPTIAIISSSLNNNIIRGSFGNGGGLAVLGDAFSRITLIDSSFDGNQMPDGGGGGGIFAWGPSWTLTMLNGSASNNAISGDGYSSGGAGIHGHSVNSTMTIVASYINNNVTTAQRLIAGGGLSSVNTILNLLDSSVSNNQGSVTVPSASSFVEGGGLYFFGNLGAPQLNIRGSTISNNLSIINAQGGSNSCCGGGIHTTGPTSIINSTISGNVVRNVATLSSQWLRGAGVMFGTVFATHTLRNVTVVNNRVEGDGTHANGGLAASGDSQNINVANTWIANNVAAISPNCYIEGSAAFVSQGNNQISNTAGCPWIPATGDQLNVPV